MRVEGWGFRVKGCRGYQNAPPLSAAPTPLLPKGSPGVFSREVVGPVIVCEMVRVQDLGI